MKRRGFEMEGDKPSFLWVHSSYSRGRHISSENTRRNQTKMKKKERTGWNVDYYI